MHAYIHTYMERERENEKDKQRKNATTRDATYIAYGTEVICKACMYVCTYVRTYVRMYVCMYIRICMNIHICMATIVCHVLFRCPLRCRVLWCPTYLRSVAISAQKLLTSIACAIATIEVSGWRSLPHPVSQQPLLDHSRFPLREGSNEDFGDRAELRAGPGGKK